MGSRISVLTKPCRPLKIYFNLLFLLFVYEQSRVRFADFFFIQRRSLQTGPTEHSRKNTVRQSALNGFGVGEINMVRVCVFVLKFPWGVWMLNANFQLVINHTMYGFYIQSRHGLIWSHWLVRTGVRAQCERLWYILGNCFPLAGDNL